jgi:hypothetical protein
MVSKEFSLSYGDLQKRVPVTISLEHL